MDFSADVTRNRVYLHPAQSRRRTLLLCNVFITFICIAQVWLPSVRFHFRVPSTLRSKKQTVRFMLCEYYIHVHVFRVWCLSPIIRKRNKHQSLGCGVMRACDCMQLLQSFHMYHLQHARTFPHKDMLHQRSKRSYASILASRPSAALR